MSHFRSQASDTLAWLDLAPSQATFWPVLHGSCCFSLVLLVMENGWVWEWRRGCGWWLSVEFRGRQHRIWSGAFCYRHHHSSRGVSAGPLFLRDSCLTSSSLSTPSSICIIPHPLSSALSADSGVYPQASQEAGPQLRGNRAERHEEEAIGVGTMATRALPLTSPCSILRMWRYSSPSRAWPR